MRHIGFRPKQAVSDNAKNREWCIDNMDYYISIAPTARTSAPEEKGYNLYNGIRTASKFEYLTKTYGVQYPAKLKHIPLVRPLIDTLIGEEWKRPLQFTVRAEDTDSVHNKQDEVSTSLLSSIIDTMLQQINEIKSQGKPTITLEGKMGKMERYYKEDYLSELEMGARKAMLFLIENLRLKSVFNDGFRDQLVTGKEFYKISVTKIGQDPECRLVDPRTIYYSGDDDIKWISDAEWIVEHVRMSPTEVLDRFGEHMSKADCDKVEDYLDIFSRETFKIANPAQLEDYNGTTSEARLDVYYCEWKSIRRISILESENKYAAEYPFLKLLSDEELQKLPGKKKEKVHYRYVEDLYQGVRIGDDIYPDVMGKAVHAVRSMERPSKVRNSYTGRCYNARSTKPYSLMLATEDLQDLYDILHFHKENLIALSGSKGVFMEMSQVPDFGFTHEENVKQWLYYKKMGVAWLDRSQEGVDKSYNQFQTYDDTLGAGISALLAMIQHIEELAGRIIGVNPQRLGAISQDAGKATTEQALVQSSLVTEPLFKEHYETIREVLTQVINAARISWKDGKRGQYVLGGFLAETFSIDKNFCLADYNVHLTDLGAEEKAVQELQMLTKEMIASGMVDIRDVFTVMRKTSIRDIENDISRALDRRQQEQAAAQKEQVAAEAQAKGAASQGADQGKAMIEMERLKLEREKMAQERDLKMQEMSDKKGIEWEKLGLEKKRVLLEQEQLYKSPGAAEPRNKSK